MFDSMRHSRTDVQVHTCDVQRYLSEQVFPHSLMIQEECDYNACVCVCASVNRAKAKYACFLRFHRCVDEVSFLVGCGAGPYSTRTETSKSKKF
jgi:hypothetical protein